MRGAHTEDRVWGQEVPRQRHRLTGYQAQGSYMLQTALRALQMHRRGPGPGFLRFPEEKGPLSRAMSHPARESKQAPPHGKRAGQVQRLGGGAARAHLSPGLWLQPSGPPASQGPLLCFPWTLPSPGLGWGKTGGQRAASSGSRGLSGTDKAIYTSGHGPTKQCIFKWFLPSEGRKYLQRCPWCYSNLSPVKYNNTCTLFLLPI